MKKDEIISRLKMMMQIKLKERQINNLKITEDKKELRRINKDIYHIEEMIETFKKTSKE